MWAYSTKTDEESETYVIIPSLSVVTVEASQGPSQIIGIFQSSALPPCPELGSRPIGLVF